MDNYIEEAKDALMREIDVEFELLDLYTLLIFTTGIHTTLKNVHDAWCIWKIKSGTEHALSHQSLRPFEELSEEVQELDREYTEAIIKVAKLIK